MSSTPPTLFGLYQRIIEFDNSNQFETLDDLSLWVRFVHFYVDSVLVNAHPYVQELLKPTQELLYTHSNRTLGPQFVNLKNAARMNFKELVDAIRSIQSNRN